MRNRLFGLFATASLTVSCLSPTINLVFVIDSNRMICTTRNRNNWSFFQLFSIFSIIILEKMRNVLRYTCRLYSLKQTKLSLKSSSPTVNISDVRQSQSVIHATGNRNNLFIAQFINRPWCCRKYSSS